LKEENASAAEPRALHDQLDEGDSYLDECGTCSRRCGVCHKDSCCNSSCEEQRTIPHIFKCTKRLITTADYLCMNYLRDEMPEDEEVLKDFGFDALIEYALKTKLLGLYQGLCYWDVPVEDIHRWQVCQHQGDLL
jgi:hypothetical protein